MNEVFVGEDRHSLARRVPWRLGEAKVVAEAMVALQTQDVGLAIKVASFAKEFAAIALQGTILVPF